MLDFLQKKLREYGLVVDEQTLATALGAIVVLVIGIAAYGYFRVNQPNTAAQTEVVEDEGELGTPGAAVSLPATHKVAAGETLWSIAEKYYSSGYNFVDVAKANNLANPGAIEVGQKLKIPKVEPKQATVAKVLKPEVTLNRITGTTYTVVKGDFLWEIALRAYGDGYRWVDIASVNKLANPDIIHAGNVLKLPR